MLKINRKEFAQALGKVKSSVTEMLENPILTCVLIQANNGVLWLTTFNMRIATKTRVLYTGNYSFTTAVNYEVLAKLVTKSIDETLTIKLDTPKLILKGDKTEFALTIADSKQFPNLIKPKQELEDTCLLNWEYYKPKLTNIVKFTSDDVTKKNLAAILFNGADYSKETVIAEIAATDSYVIAKYKLKVNSFVKDKILISNTLIMTALAAFTKEDIVELSVYGNIIKLATEDTEIIGFTVVGSAPPYNKLMDIDAKYEIELNKTEFKRHLSLLSYLESDVDSESIVINLYQEQDTLVMENKTKALGIGKTKIEAKGDYKDLNIAFITSYLLKVIEPMAETFWFNYTDTNSLALFTDGEIIVGCMPRIKQISD